MKVVPFAKASRYPLCSLEDPLFARFNVERALPRPSEICGLVDLISECRIALSDCTWEYHKRPILEKIECADWLLVMDRPFQPLTLKKLKRHTIRSLEGFHSEEGSVALRRLLLAAGPGRWVTKDIKYDIATNVVAFASNWLTSRGDEGRPFWSEGKDYANTFRTIIQEWQRLPDDKLHLEAKSIARYYGDVRHIRQQYVQADDHWQISGSSWHWRPVQSDIDYELHEVASGA